MEMILPRGWRNQEVKIKIHGFEVALEDSLPDPRDVDRVYLIEKEHREKRLDLVDAIEQTCKIIMISPTLLRAFADIPRIGYSFYFYFDKCFNMWLHLTIQGKEPVKRCLGGAIRPDSDECLLSLPEYADVVSAILLQMEEEKTTPLARTDLVILPPVPPPIPEIIVTDVDDSSTVISQKAPIQGPEDMEMEDIDEVDASPFLSVPAPDA